MKIETNTYNGNLGRVMEDETEIYKWHTYTQGITHWQICLCHVESKITMHNNKFL